MTSAVFLYGTLMPGLPRWPALKPFCTDDLCMTSAVPGRLFNTGWGWPAAIFDVAADAAVPGVVAHIVPGRLREALDVLDQIEGVDVGLFERIAVRTSVGIEAWTYEWAGVTVNFSEIQRWCR